MHNRRLGDDGLEVSAIALGGMLLSIAGRVPDDQAKNVVYAALDSGITLVDTADAYCLDDSEMNHNERLLASALKTRREHVVVITKVGCRRPAGAWTVDARPEYLVQAAHKSLEALNTETLDLLQLHAPDARVPFEESVGALAQLREQGKVRYIGLSNVTAAQIEQARKIVPIASVQNRYNPLDRRAERDGVIDLCTRRKITFLAYSPFGGTRGAPVVGALPGLGPLARKRRVSPYRLLLAWMLTKSPKVIPIVGARRPESIKDSAGALSLELDADEMAKIEATFGG